ncbi:MAG: trypsin-like peptidase domain-containing protein [Selenomonas sp.]|uniref:S1C family serine protease n=1 Tax=Selenomonas sp. TaxID=2053611 RepID=UPI0025DADA8F|nr:trypsin-like peptidase domain-containing protein [Selenomonas sp.]MCR5437974.1 trypsin-like peptidase domain-containing protein [Selenomonas sp.]
MKSFFKSMNNKKKKNLVAALMVAMSVVSFSGCSAGQADNGSSSSSSAAVQQAASNQTLSDARNTPVVRAAKTVGPTVVGITNKAVARDWFNNPVETEGVGSGVIFKNDGGKSYIVTNNHVISNAKELIVSLADGRTLKGKLIGADEMTDLAVVRVDDGKLPTAKFGDSDKIVVGEPAIAIGNPMGLEFQGSVTSGVISALNRTLDISDKRVKLLQTDAAINPGNSGGALVNADGEVIGINSAKVAANGVEGMGFSIPINTVQNVINEIMDKGYVARPYLGVSVFDPQTAARYGYQLNIDKGVYVFQLTLNGPSGKAGLQRGDIILKLDGQETNSVQELRAKIAEHKVGDTVKVTFDRNGKQKNVDVVLEEMPQDKN